jgi:hypothetical protein
MEVEKIAANRYRIRAHGHVFTVDAQDLLDAMDYGLRWAKTLEQEAKLERMAKPAQEQPPTAYLDDETRVEPGWLGD